jgi:bile acid-coenzyme A ligase
MSGNDDGTVSYPRRVIELAALKPDGVALRFAALDRSEREVTWAELDRGSTRLAHAFAARGVGFGDRVALGIRNSPELVLSVVAAWKLGATPVPVRWDLPDWERARVLEVVGAALSLTGDDRPWLQAALDDDSPEADVPLPDVTSPQTHGICSSGSTGTPKVILTDRPATFEETTGDPFPSAWMEIPRPQVILVPAPQYHTNGFAPLASMLAGDELVIMEKFDAAHVVDLVERHRVTTFTATPTMLQRIADLPGVDDRDLSSIRWILQGAAVIAPSLVERWIGLVGAERFFMAYGMTEGLGLTALRADEWLAHPGSVGRGYRDTEIRILDDDGKELPPGEIGEIFLRSPTSGLYRYLGGAPRLARTEDGFETAGDMGSLDEEGFLRIADRRVDLIVSGGANVYPAEVESALIDHPAIADVVVIGLRDDEWGRRVHAVIEPADPASPPSAEDVIAYAKSRLAAYKVPKTVELVDAIPRSEATKVSRAALVQARGG